MARATTSGNGNGNGADPALKVRVDVLDQDISALTHTVGTLRDNMATKQDINNIAQQITALAANQSAGQRPNWAALSVGLGGLIALATLAYVPISAATSDLKAAVLVLADKTVTQKQFDVEVGISRADRQTLRDQLNVTIQQQRYNADMTRISNEMTVLRDKGLSKAEFDVQHRDLKDYIGTIRGERSATLADIMRRVERMEASVLGK